MKVILAKLLIYLSAFLTGVVFVTPPAASALLTNPLMQGLSAEQYGSLFIPMIIGAMVSALVGGRLAQEKGLNLVYLFGLVCLSIGMGLFSSSALTLKSRTLDYTTLMIAMGFVGLGFGATITTLNAWVLYYFPEKFATAIVFLHGMLGLGTAAAPLLLSYFTATGYFWVDPLLLLSILLILALIMWWALPQITSINNQAKGKLRLSPTLLLLLLFMLLYGMAETLIGNWGLLLSKEVKNLPAKSASIALSIFWGAVTVGRIAVSLLAWKVSARHILPILPLIMILGYLLVANLSEIDPTYLAFAITGLGCSACFPLAFEQAEKTFSSNASTVSGLLLATYMAGYGIAAWGGGALLKEISLATLFEYAFLIPTALFILALFLSEKRREA